MLRSDGYLVCEVESDDAAMTLLAGESFDLVLLGRAGVGSEVGIERGIRERHPDLPLLRIAALDTEASPYCRTTVQAPAHVLEAIRTMLGEEAMRINASLADGADVVLGGRRSC